MHSATPPSQAGTVVEPAHFYTFHTVKLPVQRAVNSEKKGKNTKETDEKFVTVFKCDKGVNCAETEQNKKTVPYDEFANQVKQKAMQKGYDIVDKQEKLLAKRIQQFKQERATVVGENSYYKHQLQFYRFASLRPVVENYKKAQNATEAEIKMYNAKIDKYQKDLNYLQGVKGIRLGMDLSTEKIMQLVEAGQLKFGESHEDAVVWELLQQVGYDLAKN